MELGAGKGRESGTAFGEEEEEVKICSQPVCFPGGLRGPAGSQGMSAGVGSWGNGVSVEKEGWRRRSDKRRWGSERKGRPQQVFCYRAGDETRLGDWIGKRGEGGEDLPPQGLYRALCLELVRLQ